MPAKSLEDREVVVLADRDGPNATLTLSGSFDLAHTSAVVRALEAVEQGFHGCQAVDVDLAKLEHIDGSGAILLAGLLDRLEGEGCHARISEDANPEAARLTGLYRGRGVVATPQTRSRGTFTRIGEAAAGVSQQLTHGVDFTGRFASAMPQTVVAPRSINWGSLPALVQEIGADALLVTSAANLLVGLIIGFLGISQLGRFGANAYVPELVVVAQFRELGPLITAIVVAGRSGAGLASELATMKVSEEIDALRAMGFDPVRWLVVPRCLALVLVVPLLTWVGDAVALVGGFLATIAITDLPARQYIVSTAEAITANHLFSGLVKTPFLALAIGMISCGQGLAAQGGAAAVGTRTTSAVVLAILGVIVINVVFTLFYAVMGI